MALLLMALAIQTARLNSARDNLEREKAARVADRIAYKAAQDKAREQMRAENKRIEAEQEKVSETREADLTARIERLRRELRAETAKGRAGSGGASGVSPSPQGSDGEAKVCISPEQFLLGAEYEEKLDQWVKWWEDVSRINRGKTSSIEEPPPSQR